MLKKLSVYEVASRIIQHLMDKTEVAYEAMQKAREKGPKKEIIMAGFSLKDGTVGMVIIAESTNSLEGVLHDQYLSEIKQADAMVRSARERTAMANDRGPIGQA